MPVVGPGATQDGFTAAYREQADTIKALRTRLLGQYPQLMAELKLSRRSSGASTVRGRLLMTSWMTILTISPGEPLGLLFRRYRADS